MTRAKPAKTKAARPKPAKPRRTRDHARGRNNLLGYARVSTTGQELARQLDALEKAECCRIFEEKISSVAMHRPAWESLLEQLRPGDTVVVLSLDRIGRSMEEVTRSLAYIARLGAFIRSTSQPIDTSIPGHSEITLPIFVALGEIERKQLIERTREGLEAARARGRVGGRPLVLTPERVGQIRHLHAKSNTVRAIAEALHMSERSVSRALKVAPEVEPRQLRIAQ